MKKTLSLVLAIVMVFSLMPMAVLAANTDPTVTLHTTFEEGMGVGDTFTVTATLTNNPGFFAITHTLTWNEEVVEFTGFTTVYDEDEDADVLKSDVLGNFTTETGHGIMVGDRTKDSTKNGMLYEANFTIIGIGSLELGMVGEYGDEYCFDGVDAGFIDPVLDLTALEGLMVQGSGEEGIVIPEGAPFTAITTDAGDIIAIEQQDDVNGVPYYIVTIPEDAETAYVTAPDQVVMEDWNTGEMQATAYAYEIENGWNQLFISYNYEESDDGPVVEIPMYMVAEDWSGEVELCFVEDEDGYLTHAFGIEDAGYTCLGMISFCYGEASEEEDPEQTYNIFVEQTDGGTVTVDKTKAEAGEEVFVSYEAASGYRFKKFLVNGVATNLENGVLIMPSEDVTISAVFELIPPTTYAINIQNSTNGTVNADKDKAAAGEAVTLTVTPAAGYVLDTLSVVSSQTALEVINNSFTMPAGSVTISATFKKLTSGYRFATSADVSAEKGGEAIVSVKITGHTDSDVTTYNAYDVTLTFDSDKLEYVGYDGAVKSDNGQVKVDGNKIHIVGCGADKDFGTEIAALTFKTKAAGPANVTIEKVQISDREEAIAADAPKASAKHDANDANADETPDESIVVVPYGVSKPAFVVGAEQVLHGADYTFWYTDTDNYQYTGLKVTVGGVEVTVSPANSEGKYVIENVEGDIEISVSQSPKTYAVEFDKELISGSDIATYGVDYEFTVTPGEGKEIETVTVLDAAGNEMAYTCDSESGKYIIAGTDICGAFSIVVTVKDIAPTETTITFVGVEAAEVEGGLTQIAKIGKDFSFKLNKDEKFDYTVKVGETELTEKNGKYTIDGKLVVAEGVTVIITREAISQLKVEVREYVKIDGKVIFLVTAKDGDKVLAYGENTMLYSAKYTLTDETEAGAYCWLVVSTEELNTLDQVKAAAEAAITAAAEGVTATAIAYDHDVNGTTKVDINDAQLAYDLYNAVYMDFTDSLPMKKFLEADMSTDGKLDTKDVAAIVSYIVNANN